MAKAKTTSFFCSECGYESAKWLGQCPACRAWNTMVEEPKAPKNSARGSSVRGMGTMSGADAGAVRPVMLSEIPLDEEDRSSTGFDELDRVLGSGVV